MIDPGVNKLLVDESKKNDTLCTKNISKKSSETFEAFENLLGLLLNGYENVQKECTEEMIKADFTSKVPVSEESLPVTKNKFVFPIGFKDESDAVQKFNSNNLIEKIVTEVIINNEKNIPDNISQKEYSETDIKENILC